MAEVYSKHGIDDQSHGMSNFNTLEGPEISKFVVERAINIAKIAKAVGPNEI